MQKLEWKGPPRAGKVECNEVLMLGDSMLRNINVDIFGRTVHLFSYPGITTGQLNVQIKNDVMPPPSQIGYVFVHCGTNNASTLRQNMTVTQSAKEMEHCIETLMKFYTHAKIIVSGILPRNDKENLRGQDINELVHGYCTQQKQVHFVDFSSHFDVRTKPKQFSDLFRYEQTKHLPEENIDHVHLSEKGVQKFQGLIKDELDHITRTKFVNTDKGIQLLTVVEWRKFRNLHREQKFHARFKICSYEPAMNDRSQPALTNATLEAHLEDQKKNRKGSNHSDHKPLPDIIPKRPNRSESESPVPRKKSTENEPRKTSFDGDVSRSDTDPSDRDYKKKKQEPLSKSAIRNQMNKVKKSKRERSSRRTEREGERSDSSSLSPERSVKSDKSTKRRKRSVTDTDRSPAHRPKRKTDRSPSTKEESKRPRMEKEVPISPGRKISLHPSVKKKVDGKDEEKRGEDRKRSRKRSADRSQERFKDDRKERETEKKRKRDSPKRERDIRKNRDSKRRTRSRSPRDRKDNRSKSRDKKEKSKKSKRSRSRSKNRSKSRDKHSIDEAARARNISQEETKKKKKKPKVPKEESESDGPSEKVYGIELKRRASHFSENSDKVAEGLSEYLEKDKSVEKVKKEEKNTKSESDLKKRLLEKQKAKKSKSTVPSNAKVDVAFFQRLFRIVGVQKDSCHDIGKNFHKSAFDPNEKNFKNISMFDFGTKYGVPLAFRQKIKSITSKDIKKALSDKNDLRDSVFKNLNDSDLSDSQF